MKVGIIIPTRGDRPKFLANCIRMMQVQTLKPAIIEIIDHAPVSDAVDITARYQKGYESLRGKGLEAILFIEDDDWYHPTYIENMTREWVRYGRPDIFGHNQTVYYHIKEKCRFIMYHEQRSSAMNTLIVPDLPIKWGRPDDPYTDSYLWGTMKSRSKVYKPPFPICMGIKHGIGKTGGHYHQDLMDRYIQKDPNSTFLKQVMDLESFIFYTSPHLWE